MILPGVSGSFILLILGKYEYIMGTISGLTSGQFGHNLLVLGVFGAGAVAGLLSFSKFLHWLLERWHKQTLLALAGFIIGSLVKVWPWSNIETAPGTELHIWGAVCFALAGFLLVTGIEIAGSKLSSNKSNG